MELMGFYIFRWTECSIARNIVKPALSSLMTYHWVCKR